MMRRYRFLFPAVFLISLAVSFGAAAQTLVERVETELVLAAGDALPPHATVSVSQMTPVRGDVRTIEITRYDPMSGHFDARIGNGRVQKTISGRAQARARVYAPIRTIPSGERFDEADFALVSAPLSHLPKDAVLDLEAIAGMEARRSLAAARPLSASWFGMPIVVRRNAVVTISFEDPYITLTARGRALDDGAEGETVRVMHLDNTSIVEGVVEGPKRVIVQ